MSCEKHPKNVAGIKPKKLARMTADMRYKELAEYLNALAEELHKDYEKDKEAGRVKLAECLLWSHFGVWKASHGAEKAWKISKPHMKKK